MTHPLKARRPVDSGIFTELGNHHHKNTSLKCFHHPQMKRHPYPLLNPNGKARCPSAHQTTRGQSSPRCVCISPRSRVDRESKRFSKMKRNRDGLVILADGCHRRPSTTLGATPSDAVSNVTVLTAAPSGSPHCVPGI